MNNGLSRILFWVVIFSVAIVLIVLASIFRGPPQPAKTTPTPISSGNGVILTTITPTAYPKPNQSVVPNVLTTNPATCQLEGSINFINDNLYETKGAKIKYQNIDDSARLVYWKITPNEDVLSIGPNIFSGLKLPNGEREVGVYLKNKTLVKLLTLTASVTYGETDARGVEKIKISACSGSVKVTLP